MSKNVLTVRIDPPLQFAVDALAATLDRTRSWVIEQALQGYVQHHAWQVQAIQEGIDALDQGLGIPHATVRQHLANKVEAKS